MMAGIIETLSWSVDNWASMPQLVREGGRLEWLGMSVCDRVGGWMSGWVGGLVNVSGWVREVQLAIIIKNAVNDKV